MKKIYSYKDLEKALVKTLDEECNNYQFRKHLNKSFSDKKLSLKIPALLLDSDDLTDFNQLDTIEKITLINSIYTFYGEKAEVFKPSNYFSSSELTRWDTFLPTKELMESSINSIRFRNVIKISDSHYVCYMTLKELYLMKKNMLVRYNKQSQRKPNKKTIGTKGFKVEEISLNQQAKDEIKMEFKKGKFTPNLITFNILVQDNKIPNIEEDGNDIIVTPNYDRESDRTTYVDCIDGYHRFVAAYEAYREELDEGRELEGGLIVSLVEMTIEEARGYVVREFKRSATDAKWLKAITETDYTKTADEIIKKIDLNPIGISNFKDKIGIEYEDVKSFNYLSYKDVFVEAIKLSKLHVSVSSLRITETNKIANILNIILTHLAYVYFNKDYKNMLKNSYLLDCNMFAAYILIADFIKDNENYEEMAIDVAEKLYSSNKYYKELRKDLSLNHKNYSTSKIFNYFKELI